ncbi:hypothetical protein IWQ61_005087 [Dispira simplex]|nr:hypothetical protein IWQ61_005087 [Dispira simplex]
MKWISLLGIISLVKTETQVWEVIEPKQHISQSPVILSEDDFSRKPSTHVSIVSDEESTDNVYVDPQSLQAPYVRVRLGRSERFLHMTVDTSLSGIYVHANKAYNGVWDYFWTNFSYSLKWGGHFNGAKLKTRNQAVGISYHQYKNVPVTFVKTEHLLPPSDAIFKSMPLDGVIGLGNNTDFESEEPSLLSILCNNQDEFNVEFHLSDNQIRVCIEDKDRDVVAWAPIAYTEHQLSEKSEYTAIVLSEVRAEEQYPIMVNPAFSKIFLPRMMVAMWLRENNIVCDPEAYTIPAQSQSSVELILSLPGNHQLILTSKELVYSLRSGKQYYNVHAGDATVADGKLSKTSVVLGRPALKKFKVVLHYNKGETWVGFRNPR